MARKVYVVVLLNREDPDARQQKAIVYGSHWRDAVEAAKVKLGTRDPMWCVMSKINGRMKCIKKADDWVSAEERRGGQGKLPF